VKPPYFAQWESRELVEDFLSGRLTACDDPLWAKSGAKTPQEYAEWAGHLCGMACLKMVLAHRLERTIPLFDLARSCEKFGGYQKSPTGEIKGLYYKPFTDFVGTEFGIKAEICVDFPVEKILEVVNERAFFLASVHPSLRHPSTDTPAKGGHLVLVFPNEKVPGRLMFHNPSGFTKATQENVEIDSQTFDRFYASRGILIRS
jgi:hypothetical protein